MKPKTQVVLAWMLMLIMFGITTFTLYADYKEEVRQGRIMYDLSR